MSFKEFLPRAKSSWDANLQRGNKIMSTNVQDIVLRGAQHQFKKVGASCNLEFNRRTQGQHQVETSGSNKQAMCGSR